ncbi:MAG: putative DNA binding domain-containing protein [Cellulomonadaceae bacterium]|jgi:ATP-dependent DNA helicase RecG|nr:putative DNA binding domain-containing protein [Cellulomonadaceae bacterium]
MEFMGALEAIQGGACADEIESTSLECKQEGESLKRTLESMADVVVCLANATGGMLIVGVHDRLKGEEAILGVSDRLTEEVAIKGIFDRTRPSLSVPVATHFVNGKRLLEVTVPKGAVIYSNAAGTATVRVGSSCEPFPPEAQKQALAARGLYDWSAEVTEVTRYSGEDLSRLRRLLRGAGRGELAAQDDEAVLRDLRLSTDTGKLTKAGLLLVGDVDDINRVVPNHGYSYQYRPRQGSESSLRVREQRPLLDAVEHLLGLLDARKTSRPLNVSGGQQLVLEDYPSGAVRELVVNAFVHRDYERHGSVDIEQSPANLRITSPGSLVFGVTAANILSYPSTPRNTRLLEVITGLGLAERSGQGVDRAYRVLLLNGKEPPTFIDSESMVTVDIVGGEGSDAYVRYVQSDLADEFASDIEVLLILDRLCEVRQVNAGDVAPVIQRPPANAQRTLNRMASEGLIESSRRTSHAAFPNYGLSGLALTGLGVAVRYHRRTNDSIDNKVIQHIREYQFITNQTVRRMFDVEMNAARNILADLQKREIIKKEFERSRGPGVKYHAGLKFPKQ